MKLLDHHQRLSRRKLLQQLVSAPVIFQAAPLSAWCASTAVSKEAATSADLPFDDVHVSPHYPSRSPLEDVLRLVEPGSDEYTSELYAWQIQTTLLQWSAWLCEGSFEALHPSLSVSLQATDLAVSSHNKVRTDEAIETTKYVFSGRLIVGTTAFTHSIKAWLGIEARVERADFEITSIHQLLEAPLTLRLDVRYNILTSTPSAYRKQHIGSWLTEWRQTKGQNATLVWKLQLLHAELDSVSSVASPAFVDISQAAFGHTGSYQQQLQRGADYWRSVLDGACGIDIYGNNGIAAGDFDNDGFDDLYVSQPAGLPNRLYHNLGNGTFEDVTERAGVGVLDNTSCALFADLRNVGLQDLLVVCGNGPILFINQGDGTFRVKRDAFRFAKTPQGTFTHAAIADYNLDGHLDVYFCVYSYYLGLDQYHYPIPYFDARNGPPNFLFHNQGDATFIDKTEAAGLNVENNRYSFACAWGQASTGTYPDLYVVNDFGRNVLYRNNGNGTFHVTSSEAHVEDVGAGMSACWADTTNNGRSDLYAANMWSAAGQRVSQQPAFHLGSAPQTRELYRTHANGNTLYRNRGDGTFSRAAVNIGVDVGRWAWSSDFLDFDHDGYLDLYVTNGYITAPKKTFAKLRDADTSRDNLDSFFWRQVVGKSPDDSTPSLAYEHGWNALNELIRSDHSWSGSERNVVFVNNRDGTFSDVSGVSGLDFQEDGRSFVLADFDGDGRLEVALKSRNAPQLRLLYNNLVGIGDSLTVRLRGTKSNRDAIGSSVTIKVGDLLQTRYLHAGSGFLAQHTKELFFGLGKTQAEITATIHWPSGLIQTFSGLSRNRRITFTEGVDTSAVQLFASRSAPSSLANDPSTKPQQVPSGIVETWLIDPLRAPDFVLPDLAGRMISLDSHRDTLTLLLFYSAASQQSMDTVKSMQENTAAFKAEGLQTLALTIDRLPRAERQPISPVSNLDSSVLVCTDEVLGTYNIIYRYLFDRRQDLPVPCGFLLDKECMIIKIYQGPIQVSTLLRDIKKIPTTMSKRLHEGLPFAGTLFQTDFLRNDFTYGVAMFQHGYLRQAETSFKQAVLKHPQNAEGYYNLGTLNLRKQSFAQARVYLEQTLKLRADYPEAWNNLGMMAAQEGNTDEAIKYFNQSLDLRPGYAVALLNLGNAYRRQGNNTLAKNSLTKALALQPDDSEVNYSLGLFYAQQGELKPAEEYLKQAIYLRPDYAEALNNLGVLFIHKQDYQQAAITFKACITKMPTFEQSYLNLARLYTLQNDLINARETLTTLLRVLPGNVAAQRALQSLEITPSR